MAPRCKFCVAGNPVDKEGWHALHYFNGQPINKVFCEERIKQAEDMMAQGVH